MARQSTLISCRESRSQDNLGHDTDKRLKRNRPDITAVHKETQERTLIDEVKRIHRAPEVEVIPIVIGAPGIVSTNAKVWFGK